MHSLCMLWFRCAKNHLVNLRDQYGGEKSGHWTCVACFKRYKPGQADKFIFFVIGNAQQHFMGCLGDLSQSFRNELQYLKTCTLLEKIGKVPITNEIILQALCEINTEAEGHLGLFLRVRTYNTRDPNKLNGVYHYSESATLSIEKAGTPIQAFVFRGRPMRALNDGFLRNISYLCAACLEHCDDDDQAASDDEDLNEAYD